MSDIRELLGNNARWAEKMRKESPGLFERTAKGQRPRYFWLGCCDSRVHPTHILGLGPGEVFIHRNVGNLVFQNDTNLNSALQFAVDFLKVTDILLSGHTNCGAAARSRQLEDLVPLDNWLKPLESLWKKNKQLIEELPEHKQADKVAEINVYYQMANLCRSPVVSRAWERGENLTLHGLMYELESGTLRELNLKIDSGQAAKSFLANLA